MTVHNTFFFFFQAEDGIRDLTVTGVQTCALPILPAARHGGDLRCSSGDDRELPGRWVAACFTRVARILVGRKHRGTVALAPRLAAACAALASQGSASS